MAQLMTMAAILQHALAQPGITQQEIVGGSLYCEMINRVQADGFQKDLQERVSQDTEVRMYRLGQGRNRDRQEYVYDFVPRTEQIPPEVQHQVEWMAEIQRGR